MRRGWTHGAATTIGTTGEQIRALLDRGVRPLPGRARQPRADLRARRCRRVRRLRPEPDRHRARPHPAGRHRRRFHHHPARSDGRAQPRAKRSSRRASRSRAAAAP